MIIHSLRVGRFKKFSETIEVADLDQGLNVLAGDNEAGKTTLIQALRAALFEKYKSSVGESYRPYGQDVSPTIEVGFSLDGKRYSLKKTFSKRQDAVCDLRCNDGGRWDGPAAEEHLSNLLGFDYPGRGPSKLEHQGLPGLLWVEQGHAHQPIELNDGSRSSLHSVFDEEMSDLLGGDTGEALFASIAIQREEYFDKRDNPRGEYKKLAMAIEKATDDLAHLEDELAVHEHKVQRLQSKSDRLRSLKQGDEIDRLKIALAEAQERLRVVQGLQAQIAEADGTMRQTKAESDLADSRHKSRRNQVEDDKAAEAQVASLRTDLANQQKVMAPLLQELESTRNKLGQLRLRYSEIVEAISRARRRKARDETRSVLQRAAASLNQVRKAQESATDARNGKAQIAVDQQLLDRIRQADRNVEIKRQQLASCATHLQFQLEDGVAVQLDGHRLENSGERNLTNPAVLQIDGVGQLSIRPGGSDLADVANDLSDAQQTLNAALAEGAVDSLSSAEDHCRRRDQLEAQIAQADTRIETLAPDGTDHLQALVEEQTVVLKRLEEALEDASDNAASLEDLEESESFLAKEREALEETIERSRKRVESSQHRRVELETGLQSAERSAKKLSEELRAAREESSDDELADRCQQCKDALSTAQQQEQILKEKLADHDPEVVQSEFERHQINIKQREDELDQLKRDVRELQIELNTLGQQGLAEQVASGEGELEFLRSQYESMDNRAKALDLLYRTMSEELSTAKEAVARPIVEKMRPYLRQLLPDTAAVVDEDLLLTGVERSGDEQCFEDLSLGTREQLAILIRLAYADLLTENGVPVCVILDDALVNTDHERRESMKAILYQAAKRYQIILLTCHGDSFRDTGGRFFEVDELVGSSNH